MRRLANGSRFALPGARRRLLRQFYVLPVRGGAQRSSSPAFLVPLRSDRGSLARSSRLLVLVMASLFDCASTLSEDGSSVNVRQCASTGDPRRGAEAVLARLREPERLQAARFGPKVLSQRRR